LWLAAAEVAVAADAVAAEFGVAAAGEVVAGAPPAAAQVGEAAAGANYGSALAQRDLDDTRRAMAWGF
jgi:hypothetical protein